MPKTGARHGVHRVGIAADHGGFALKQRLVEWLGERGFEVVDYGAESYDPNDDYPDLVVPLARSVASGDVERGIALCGSGVGASVIANKVPGVRAAILHDHFSARQGVEDDDVNIQCLGGRVLGEAAALDVVLAFLTARFRLDERYVRRRDKVLEIERKSS